MDMRLRRSFTRSHKVQSFIGWVNLSKDELEIVECFVQGWDESGHKLFGGISYQAVMDLLNKLGLEVPSRLQYFLDRSF